MCGAFLDGEEEAPEADEKKRRVPGWIGSVVAALLGLAILAGGGFGLYTMLVVEPDAEPTAPAITRSPTLTPTASATPTSTPVPTFTPTPLPPRAHSVQEGETMSDIAKLYGITVDEILTLNPDVDPELIRADQVLLIPAAPPTPATPQPGAATTTPGGFLIHVVESGETLSAIAREHDVPLSLIQAANDLSPEDETIRAGQSLIIPQPTPTVSPPPTTVPNVTSTPAARYAAPALLYPAQGAVFAEGEAPVLLQWASVSVLRDNEWYQLSVRQAAGGVVSSTIRTRATAWRVPLDLLQRAGADAAEFEWRVQVVREAGVQTYEEAGSPSETRSFNWREPPPTPTSPTTPTP
ncbi:MAG: LysM domain-containing protein [Anaerolineae bacterium]|jgi:LysM repeat protein